MVRKGGDKMAQNDQKCWSQPGFELGAFQREKKVRIFCLKLYHWATQELYNLWVKYFGKIAKQQPLPNWYETWLKFDPILYTLIFSDKKNHWN